MRNRFLKGCAIFGIIGILVLGIVGVFWYYFYGPTSGALPSVRFIQPTSETNLTSGQGLVLVIEGRSDIGLDRIEISIDGLVQANLSAFGKTEIEVSYPWFSTGVGDHEISVVGFDRGGRASQPASVMVRVERVNVQVLVQDSELLDVRQELEDVVNGVAGSNQGDAGAPVGQPPPEQPEPQPGDPAPAPDAVDPAEPDLGEPIQADNEPPTVELIVNPLRVGNGVAVSINARARDNQGLDFMQLIVQPPVSDPRQYVSDCGGAMDCVEDGGFPLSSAGQWAFVLRAVDLSAQVSLPKFALVQVICLGGVDENNQPILNCAIAEEIDPEPGGQPGGAIPVDQGFLDPDVSPILEPINAAEELLCHGLQPPQESFVVGGNCNVILPVNMPNGPFTNCGGREFSLLNVDLRGVDLRNATLFQADLRKADLTCGTDLRGADLRWALFQETKVTASTQLDARWRLVWELVNMGGYLRNLNGVELNNADLTAVDFVGANLNAASFQGSDLRHANLFAADLTGANLQQVTWGNTTCPDGTNSDNNGGTCEGIPAAPLARNESFVLGDCEIVLPVNMPNGPYTDCEHADLHGRDLRNLDLRNANFFDVEFIDADLRGANLTGADLRGARFTGAIMDETTGIAPKWRLVWRLASRGGWRQDLTGVDLTWAMLEFTNMQEAILDGANLTHADFRGGNLEGARFNGTIWSDTWCPDGTNSDNVGGTCEGHLVP